MHKHFLALVVVFVLLLGVFPASTAWAANSAITLPEIPATDPDTIKIVKESNGKTITESEAIFKVEFFANAKWTAPAARTWYFKTIDGETWLEDKAYYLATCAYGKSDALYENSLGAPVFPLGTIRVSEVQAPDGYLKSDFKLEGKITQDPTGADAVFEWTSQPDNVIRYEKDTVYIDNIPLAGNLKIVKKTAKGNTPLAGAGFRILDAEGKMVNEGYTDANGELTFEGLLVGEKYSYQEFEAPKGFRLDDTLYPFELTEGGKTVVIEKVNYPRPSTIQIKKQDSDGSALKGAVFLLEYSVDGGSSWSAVYSRDAGDEVPIGGCTSSGLADGSLTSGDDGIVTFSGLYADGEILYRVTETHAPEGMALIAGPLYIGTLPVTTSDPNTADSETIDGATYAYTLYITATDSSSFHLPETGSLGFAFIPLAMLFMTALIIFKFNKENIYESI